MAQQYRDSSRRTDENGRERHAIATRFSAVHSDDAAFDGLQVALEVGQIGTPDYFVAIRNGRR